MYECHHSSAVCSGYHITSCIVSEDLSRVCFHAQHHRISDSMAEKSHTSACYDLCYLNDHGYVKVNAYSECFTYHCMLR